MNRRLYAIAYLQSLKSQHTKAKRYEKVKKMLGDGAYDSHANFSYLVQNDIIPGIKVRVSSVCGNGKGDARDRVVKQQKRRYTRCGG